MSSYYNQGVQVIVGNGQNFPGTPRISLIPFIQNAYDKGLLNFTVLPPGSISLVEIQDISTAKILGRSTAGSGVIEQISIGTGLSLSGGTLSSTVTATPGGSDTQIQYNNAGAFAGSSNLVTTSSNMLDIQGSGSTSATNAIRVRNSSGTQLLSVRNNGNVAYTNASVTSSNANDAILGITDFTHTANSGTTNALWGLNIDGTQTFNTANQTSGGLRIKIATNATTSQYNIPLYIESNAATDAINYIKNTSSTGGSSIRLINGSAETSMTIIQSPNSNPSSISEGSGITIRTSTTHGSMGMRGSYLSLVNSSTSGNPQSVNPTFFILDKRIGIGQYAPNAPNATLDIKGEGATSATSSLIVKNSSNHKALEIKDDRTIFGYNNSGQLTTALGDITSGAMGIGTRNNQFTYGAIDVSTNSGLRILSRSTGISYIDGYSEGSTKALNYDIVIGSRVNNTGHTITNNSTAETGSNVQIGFETTTNPRAILSLNTKTRGFLPPRLTTTERDAVTWVSGDEGMIIFNTTAHKHQGWDGSTWNDLY